jgi:hypothetical protein
MRRGAVRWTLQRGESFGFGFEFRRIRSRRGLWMPMWRGLGPVHGPDRDALLAETGAMDRAGPTVSRHQSSTLPGMA